MTGKPLGLDAVADLSDPVERAREAERLAAYATATAAAARHARDSAIRAAYAAGGITRAELAEQVGTTPHVVVTALRARVSS